MWGLLHYLINKQLLFESYHWCPEPRLAESCPTNKILTPYYPLKYGIQAIHYFVKVILEYMKKKIRQHAIKSLFFLRSGFDEICNDKSQKRLYFTRLSKQIPSQFMHLPLQFISAPAFFVCMYSLARSFQPLTHL